MKICVLYPNENWIIDRLGKKWKIENKNLLSSIHDCDIIWCLANYQLSKLLKKNKIPKNKFIITTIHHIPLPNKVNDNKKKMYKLVDENSNLIHYITKNSEKLISKYFKKPKILLPFWNDEKIWFNINDKSGLRKKYNIDPGCFLIGSFQRDTEGHSIKNKKFLPKLEKGPDIFIKAVIKLKKKHKNIKVLLGGWRRQFVIKKLEENKIDYYYYERKGLDVLNELYNCLDLYIVSSRREGGPRAINECGLNKTPLITTRVGISEIICHPKSFFDGKNINTILNCETDIEFNFQNAMKYSVENYMKEFNQKLFNI